MHPSAEKTDMIKDQLKNEAEAWDHKQRFGLFSYKAHHGFGARDDTTKLNHRDDNGKVKTAPKNFMGGRPKSANVRLDAFTRTGYLSQNDEYINPSQTMKYRESSGANKIHKQAFKPSADVPSRTRAPYEFVSDPIEPTQAGNIPKNFVTTGLKSGYGNTTYGHLFSQPKYHIDPFDHPQEVDTKERRDHVGKIRSGPFYNTFKKRDHFTVNYRLYRNPPGMSSRPKTSYPTASVRPFLRSDLPRGGYNRTINRFPEYTEQPPEEPALGQNQGKEGKWKIPCREFSKPSPSVQQYNGINRARKPF
jgi:hypothetical protein